MDDRTFAAHTTHRVTREQMKEGFMPELYDPTKGGGVLGRGVPGVVWHRCVRPAFGSDSAGGALSGSVSLPVAG